MRERYTRQPGNLHNLIAGGFIAAAGIMGLLAFGELAQAGRTQGQYESLARMASKEDGVDETEDGKERLLLEKRGEEPPLYQSPVDFKLLSGINPDIAAWIRVPDTGINYPIVQSRDNEMYLHKSFSGETADAGCIFLDFESQRNLRGYNNILYGHNMKDGTMFRDVVRYKDEDYFKEHQYFEIYTPVETIHLKAAACYYIQDDSQVRRTQFRDEEEFFKYVRSMLEPCQYAYIPQKPVRNLYTLVTCSYEVEDGRTVLFAVEVDGGEHG